MSDKNVYIWDAWGDRDGLPIGGQAEGKNIDLIFDLGRSLEMAMEKWRSFKGVYDVIHKKHDDANYIEKVNRTLDWYKKRYPLAFVSNINKEELEKLDVLNLDLKIPFGNQKVINILQEQCPNEFEAFPITINCPGGPLNNYFLINITHRIENALDKPNCIYKVGMFQKEGEEDSISGTGGFKRLLFNEGCMGGLKLGRLYEDLGRVMVHKSLIDAFVKADIQGINSVILEDYNNGFYRSNYMPDGETLKV